MYSATHATGAKRKAAGATSTASARGRRKAAETHTPEECAAVGDPRNVAECLERNCGDYGTNANDWLGEMSAWESDWSANIRKCLKESEATLDQVALVWPRTFQHYTTWCHDRKYERSRFEATSGAGLWIAALLARKKDTTGKIVLRHLDRFAENDITASGLTHEEAATLLLDARIDRRLDDIGIGGVGDVAQSYVNDFLEMAVEASNWASDVKPSRFRKQIDRMGLLRANIHDIIDQRQH